MKILLIKPHKPPHPLEVAGTLESMQALVGGTIQAIYPFEEPIALICNEEGKLLGLPLNRALFDSETGELYDIIAGTFFLCGAPPDSDNFTSLTDTQLEKYAKYFHSPESFMKVNEQIVVIPDYMQNEEK